MFIGSSVTADKLMDPATLPGVRIVKNSCISLARESFWAKVLPLMAALPPDESLEVEFGLYFSNISSLRTSASTISSDLDLPYCVSVSKSKADPKMCFLSRGRARQL